MVSPYASRSLTGADVRKVLLWDLRLADLSEHAAIGLLDRIAFYEVANALDPAHATTTNRASVLG